VSQTDVDVVESVLNAFNAGDLEAAFGHIHPDFVLNEVAGLPYGGDWVGLEGFQKLLGAIFTPFEMGVDEYTVSDAGSCVMVKLLMTFTARSSGQAVKMPGVELYTIKDGKIAYLDVFYKDTKTIADLATS